MYRQPSSRRHVARQLLLMLLLLAGAAWFVELRREAGERRRYPAPGLIVVEGQRRLHLVCEGAVQPGVAPVILEAGAGDSHLAWAAVQAELAEDTRVCTYDRPGYGWSDPAPGPRTADVMAEELQTLLAEAGITGPYVLVGQGVGGVIVYRFAQLYPESVAGLVFVSLPDTGALVVQPEPVRAALVEVARLPLAAARWLAPFGGMRWLVRLGVVEKQQALPQEVQAPARMLAYRSQTWRTALAEMGALGESAVALAEGGDLPAVPVTELVPAGGRSFLYAPALTVVEAPVAEEDLHIVQPGLVVEAVEEMLAIGD